jgi:FtsZ-interacting cell division protein ZipA
MPNGYQKLKIIRKKPKLKQLKNDENGWLIFYFIDEILHLFAFSLKRKGNSKHKKPTDSQNPNKTDESSSSSSGDEDEKASNTETNTAEIPVSKTEENQSVKEPLQQKQPHEKSDIRKHIRHRQTNSSDEEAEKNGTSS